jgi:hypothetical protein
MSSEFIYGEPPPEMEQIPPLLASRLFRIWISYGHHKLIK